MWSSRHHRKGIANPEDRSGSGLWRIQSWGLLSFGSLNWWIGIIFALGSALFAAASVLSLAPHWAESWQLSPSDVNAVFFAGSIPFTTAALLQLIQVLKAREAKTSFFRWHLRDIGWLSCLTQFVGTILFNFNTFDAMIPGLSWLDSDLIIWGPNLVGSVLFLLSGYLALVETCHAHWAFRPRDISWWIGVINFLGCLGFMASALLSVYLPGPVDSQVGRLALAFTLQGALCFFVGAVLLLPEASESGES